MHIHEPEEGRQKHRSECAVQFDIDEVKRRERIHSAVVRGGHGGRLGVSWNRA